MRTNNHVTRAYTPPLVEGVSITAISTSYLHTCAVVTGGGLLCWGKNDGGQLGIKSTINQYVPTAVSLGSGKLEPGDVYTHSMIYIQTHLRCVICA
jgi:alpha-tubulin suppressor-like RCC1 family protein